MKPQVLKVICVIIYIIYAALFVWQISYANNTQIYAGDKGYSEILPFSFEEYIFRYSAAMVLLLFVALLFIHIILRQQRLAIFSSFFAAAVLSVYEMLTTWFSFALLIFGLTLAFFELRNSVQNHKSS